MRHTRSRSLGSHRGRRAALALALSGAALAGPFFTTAAHAADPIDDFTFTPAVTCNDTTATYSVLIENAGPSALVNVTLQTPNSWNSNNYLVGSQNASVTAWLNQIVRIKVSYDGAVVYDTGEIVSDATTCGYPAPKLGQDLTIQESIACDAQQTTVDLDVSNSGDPVTLTSYLQVKNDSSVQTALVSGQGGIQWTVPYGYAFSYYLVDQYGRQLLSSGDLGSTGPDDCGRTATHAVAVSSEVGCQGGVPMLTVTVTNVGDYEEWLGADASFGPDDDAVFSTESIVVLAPGTAWSETHPAPVGETVTVRVWQEAMSSTSWYEHSHLVEACPTSGEEPSGDHPGGSAPTGEEPAPDGGSPAAGGQAAPTAPGSPAGDASERDTTPGAGTATVPPVTELPATGRASTRLATGATGLLLSGLVLAGLARRRTIAG